MKTPSVDEENFTFSFHYGCSLLFIHFSALIALGRTSSKVLKRRGESRFFSYYEEIVLWVFASVISLARIPHVLFLFAQPNIPKWLIALGIILPTP